MSRHYRTTINPKQLYRITTQILDGTSFSEIAQIYSHSAAWASDLFYHIWNQYKTPSLMSKLEIHQTYKKNTIIVDFLREVENRKEFLRELESRLLKKTG